jgi:hypothetical protein
MDGLPAKRTLRPSMPSTRPFISCTLPVDIAKFIMHVVNLRGCTWAVVSGVPVNDVATTSPRAHVGIFVSLEWTFFFNLGWQTLHEIVLTGR